MAVIVDPPEFASSPAVKVYSDAPDNIAAIKEIDGWARQNGFLRTRESHLHAVSRNHQVLYWGLCWRPTEEDRRQAEADIRRYAERREKMPMTASSDLLLREDA